MTGIAAIIDSTIASERTASAHSLSGGGNDSSSFTRSARVKWPRSTGATWQSGLPLRSMITVSLRSWTRDNTLDRCLESSVELILRTFGPKARVDENGRPRGADELPHRCTLAIAGRIRSGNRARTLAADFDPVTLRAVLLPRSF